MSITLGEGQERPFRWTVREAAGGVNHVLETPPVPQGTTYVLKSIRVCNQDGLSTEVNVYISTGEGMLPILHGENVAKGALTAMFSYIMLREGETLVAMLTGVAAGDRLSMVASGDVLSPLKAGG